MENIKSRNFPTLTASDFQTIVRPDGVTALLVETREAGPIAISVDLSAVELLRHQLADAEKFLRAHSGHAYSRTPKLV